MRKIRLFTSGTHNSFTFTNDEIKAIYTLSIVNPDEKIPFVIGHPKNDLPIVGWVKRGKLQFYQEGDKSSIGISRNDAEFSEESIALLKKLKNDKISIKLSDSVITHIGLVEKAAVKENNDQEFNADSKSGVLCFSEDFVFEVEKEGVTLEQIKNYINQIFSKNQNPSNMEDKEKIAQLEAQVAEFKAKEKEATDDNRVKDLEAQIAVFQAKEKEDKKAEFKAKVENSTMDAETQKKTLEFGQKLIDTDIKNFESYEATLNLTPKKTPPNGNVLNGKKVFASEEEVDINAHYSSRVNELLNN